MATQYFDNQSSLDDFLSLYIEGAINDLSESIMLKLQSFIVSDVYNYGNRDTYFNDSGEPTWEFLNSFQWKQTEASIKSISKEMFYNYSSMGIHRASVGFHAHGGFGAHNTILDMREPLAQILNDTRLGFWDNFVEWLDENFESEFKKSARKVGLNLTN